MGIFEVERSVLIDVPVDQVYTQVRDFQTWPIWSPWLGAEPGCLVEHSPEGTEFKWQGEVVGTGQMKVVKESRNQSIDYELTLLQPWQSTSQVSFTFRPEGERTRIFWKMNGKLPFYLFWMQGTMEAEIGMDYKRGLLSGSRISMCLLSDRPLPSSTNGRLGGLRRATRLVCL